MSEPTDLLRRQSEWPEKRRNLTWPEKVRLVESIRDDVIRLRATRTHCSEAPRQLFDRAPEETSES